MTNLRTAAQQALEALEEYQEKGAPFMSCDAAADALRAALEEPVQEPVAWLFTNLQSGDYDFCYQEDEHDHDREMWHKQPLYIAPPQRKPLTEEEIRRIKPVSPDLVDFRSGVRCAEWAHGIGGNK